jgi:formylglycine-generating enzyme required for sulfatase activity
MSDNGVFISYRRDTGSEVARLIQEYLEGQGFDVFLDVDGLGAGHFDEQLLREIESRRNFVLICSPGCLERCVHERDWVRRELEHAIQTDRHIVPVEIPPFAWPEDAAMPPAVAELKRHNSFEYNHSHWRTIKPTLVKRLRVKRAGAAVTSEVAPAPKVAPAPATSRQPRAPQTWCDVIAESPDPSVVTDAQGRARMLATGLPWKVRDRKTGIVMLLCPPGEFMMGSPASEAGRGACETQHRRTIGKAFYLGETEVTQEQWLRVKGENPSYFRAAKNPVEQVSWDDCQRFCASTGLRLPSEAEWEYACRAGTTGAYAGPLDAMAWYGVNSGNRTHAVASKKVNPWGLFDMHGNVWEWCEDGYGDYPVGAATQTAARAAEVGARVLRGGGWLDYASVCRAAYRFSIAPGHARYYVGFRVARTPD